MVQGGAGGSNFVDPCASVLQISAAICLAANGLLFYPFAYESKLSTLQYKIKPLPCGSGSACLIVELAGIEPASIHGDHMLSTCLVLLDFRDLSAAEQPNLSLFPVCFAIGSEQPSD